MSAPIIKSRRQHLRLWFEFYKLCYRAPVVSAGKGVNLDFAPNLKKSAEFYAPWGDVRTVKFDAWWKDHQHLFGETLVQEVSAVTPHPDVMHLAVPLNQTVSKSLEQIEGLINPSSAVGAGSENSFRGEWYFQRGGLRGKLIF